MSVQDEMLTGVLTCKPNGKNPRDLDITIEYHFKGAHGEVDRVQHYRMR
jgi:protein arginine N-methyltransferase 1